MSPQKRVATEGGRGGGHSNLASDVFLDEFVLSLVAQDDVDLLGTWPADIRTCTHTHTHTHIHTEYNYTNMTIGYCTMHPPNIML